MIQKCRDLYKFVDYIHFLRNDNRIVALRSISAEPPKYYIDALFHKLKADQMKFIYECLGGDNGLLTDFDQTYDFSDQIKLKAQNIDLRIQQHKIKDFGYRAPSIGAQNMGLDDGHLENDKDKTEESKKEAENDEKTLLKYFEEAII